MRWPLKFQVTLLGEATIGFDSTGTMYVERGEPETIKVFSHAVVNGTTSQQSPGLQQAPYLQTVERLQVIAPPGLFPIKYGDLPGTVNRYPGDENWMRVDAEENVDANPYYSPGLSIYYFERETAETPTNDYITPGY